jgi:hypothetical protein
VTAVVVDTNVPIAANGGDKIAADCTHSCVTALREVLEYRQRLAIDDDWRIIREYMRNLRSSGEPGVGDSFLKWVLTHKNNPERCDLVTITALNEAAGEFAEFPDGSGLTTFDPSDRKFVAVANAHAEKPTILQGLDSKWWGWRAALAAAGITVEFLCPALVSAAYERKFGSSPVPKKARRG